jgi:alpha-D-ribose 1-methylphosphonate 5-triphosphate synthase subunit PhnL
VEAIVLQSLRDVDRLDACRVVEGPNVEDELVRATAVLVRVQDLIMRLELAEEVVRVQKSNFGCLFETLAT